MLRDRRTGGIAIALLCLSAWTQGTALQAGTAEISGIVVDAVSGRPIPAATVTIAGLLSQATGFGDDVTFFELVPYDNVHLSVLTDANGAFRVAGLRAGAFEITADKSGWLSGSVGRKTWNDGSHWVVLGDSQRLAGTRVPMWRMPSISGRVIDAHGQPAIGLDVAVFKAMTTSDGLRLTRESGGMTDDRGMYALSTSPGDHVVAVVLRDFSLRTTVPPPRSLAGRPTAYQTTFYPGTMSAASAAHVVVAPGEDRQRVDFGLASSEAFRINVRINPAPIREFMQVRLSQPGVEFDDADASPIDTKYAALTGLVELTGVPVGSYELSVFQPPTMPSMTHGIAPLTTLPSEPTLWARVPVTVVDGDLNVPVVIRSGARISGRVEFDGVTSLPSLETLAARAMLVSNASGRESDFRGLYLSRETFTTIQLPPGEYLLRPAPPEGWQLKSVIVNGRDVTDAGLTLDSRDLGDVVMTFTDRRAAVRGRVTVDPSLAMTRAWVMAFPDDRSLWRGARASRRTRLILTGADNTYSAELPPGEYLVAATDVHVERTADSFAKLAGIATRVQVTDGQTTTLDVRLQRAPR